MNKSIEIKKLEHTEVAVLQELVKVFNKVFEEKGSTLASATYLQKLLTKKEFIVMVALCEGKVIGGLTAYEMPMYTQESSEVYIYDVAVLNEFQRMGVGKKLLAELGAYCKQHNISTMMVEAHEEDKHAIDFYTKNGADAEKVVHFNFDISPR